METFPRGTLHPWFVTGLLEGLGSFTFSRSGNQISVYFALKAGPRDTALLDSLQAFFGGLGRSYSLRAGKARYFRITRRADLARVVQHFDRYPLRGGKSQAFALWRQMVMVKQSYRKPDRARLEALAGQLSLTTGHAPRAPANPA